MIPACYNPISLKLPSEIDVTLLEGPRVVFVNCVNTVYSFAGYEVVLRGVSCTHNRELLNHMGFPM